MKKDTYQLLIGSMLGDGCISKNTVRCKNYCFKEMHGPEQREYVKWKSWMLREYGCVFCGARPELFTRTMSIFTRLRTEMYGKKNHKNKITNHHFNYINLFGLLVWYLDDGTWQHGQINIKCESFSKNDLDKLVNIINNKYALDIVVYDYPYTRIVAFRKASADKIIPIWKNMFTKYYIPSSMSYKLGDR